MSRITENTPVSFRDEVPPSVDVVIIGGGIIGISTAWYLRKAGYSVLVCEKGRVAGEQSSRNWGWVRVTLRDPAEVPLAIDSIRCWQEINDELDENIGFATEGSIVLAQSEKEMTAFEEWKQLADSVGYPTELLSPNQLSDHLTGINVSCVGGVRSPGDSRAEPFVAVPAIARNLQKQGGLVRENCAVRTIERSAGRLNGVVTESGPVRCDTVVCAAGAWSSLFLANMGIKLPQLVVRGTVARTEAYSGITEGCMGLGDIYVRRRGDGGFTLAEPSFEHFIGGNSFRFLPEFLKVSSSAKNIHVRLGSDPTQRKILGDGWSADASSPFEQTRVLEPKINPNSLRRIQRNLAKRVPAMKDVRLAESWAGMIDAMPDVVPVIDSITDVSGLFLATGFSGHGFGIGPAAGKVMANLVQCNEVKHDITRFRYSRFVDGSKLIPGPAI